MIPPCVKSRFESFPHCGKLFSIVWKNPENFFHCVEKRARRPQDVDARKRIWKNEGLSRQNKRPDFSMMPLCGRPEQDPCPRAVDLEAAERKRRAFVLPPRFFKSFFACPPLTPATP
jgi:hypothetical protein